MTPLQEAYLYCRRLTHRSGPHFSIGFRFLPLAKQNAIYAVYAFCRYADDIVDERQTAPLETLLIAWREELERCYQQLPTHPITVALADAILRYPIPKEGFLELMEGCRMDLLYNRYPTFDSLMVYCDKVATTIRDLSLPIFGISAPQGLAYGRALSTALQLTNIIRDIGEDLERGRIYLPLDELKEAGYSEEELLRKTKNDAFLRLMRFQIGRVRGYFKESALLIPLVDPDARLALSLMRNVYLKLTDRIEKAPFNVLDRPLRLSRFERWKVGIETLLLRR